MLPSIPILSVKTAAMAILGISTNTRLLGLAIIDEEGLSEHCVRLFKSSWSPAKATRIITSLEPCVRQYCIKAVVLSIPAKHHQNAAVKSLLKQLTRYFESNHIPVHTCSVASMLQICHADEKKTKRNLMKALVSHYPQLNYCYQKELRNKKRYFIKVFEAIAAARLRHE